MIVFINKLDREGKDAIDLLDEIEGKLGLTVTPLSWPIGMGQRFQGVYNLYEKHLVLFHPHGKGDEEEEESIAFDDLSNPQLDAHIGKEAADELREEVHMITTVYPEFDKEAYLSGELSPVFFGSAVNNFGVRELLDCFVEIAPVPRSRKTEERMVEPTEDTFSGFVFKIHANIDPRHRDRIAFLRVCSGQFERGQNYYHVRQERSLRFSNPTAFMASRKSIVDKAYPGDIVGLYDTGNFKIGDAVTTGETLNFVGIPNFSPEEFRRVVNRDPMKTKQLNKGLDQLMDEGVAQLFTKRINGDKIVGTVGALQFDVIQYRLEHEYGARCDYEPVTLHRACWIDADDPAALREFEKRKLKDIAEDSDGKTVFLAESAWMLQMAQENFPDVRFHFTSEF
jgi:peptide chain release factor 3